MGLHQCPSERRGEGVRVRSLRVPSHVPSHPQTAAKVRGFSPIASGFTAETDWLLEEAGFELPVPPERKAALDRVRRPSVSGETVANAILELASQLDLMGLALIFKLGAMPYDMVERSMTFGEDVVPRIRPVLDRDATANFAATTPALHFA